VEYRHFPRLFPGDYSNLIVTSIINRRFQQFSQIFQRRRLCGKIIMRDTGGFGNHHDIRADAIVVSRKNI
jgi:hypothetical protein